ncbi:protein translocase subunit SecF [Alkalibacter saccharofermentans]|uniref:Protein-export membrane protein SecF n=1 Tax=Alkalibacter saccharofermentans DSM 14828 TaxID=1120975 RepID=A0A1M4S4B0_9FIRM|nr:protein translocase subunit SecF [Alkalibacter saccharofermentans]SHE27028.1 protein translocase subunit secF [Alkalibacter saccharofermentans DSM 14828]
MKVNITKNHNKFFMLSAVLLIISVGALLFNGLNLGIDFIGGTIVQVDLNQEFETGDVREFTDKFDESADITYAGEDRHQMIISTRVDMEEDQRAQLIDDLTEKYGSETEVLSIDNVSATIGNELKSQALLAVGVAILGMLVYITFRFEFLFGIAAIIALVHDVIIVLGVYALFGIQVNTPFIAAILTILGYSINDTIVVFDRIRENRSKYKRNDFVNLVDNSIHQTLRRSINTSLTTILAISALYFVGVQSIKDFTLPMIVGFVSGTYSSIFIASSFWYMVKERRRTDIKVK